MGRPEEKGGGSPVSHDETVAALLRPSTYPHPVERVTHLQTHISDISLTGGLVYKLKKPVSYSFLDFSTLEKRRFFCREEHRLNSRLAPSVYQGVVPLTEGPEGPRLDGKGRVLDWLVRMRELSQERMGRAMIARGELDQGAVEAVVEKLIPFYRKAATGTGVDNYGERSAVRFNVAENYTQTRGAVGIALSRERFADLVSYTDDYLDRERELFRQRVAGGFIREGHGDLHLDNICFEDEPVIYDCIEFNPRLRCLDIACDLGFLAMDLDRNGRPDLGRHLVETYAARSGDEDLLRIIDFYKCYRAYVRGKVMIMTWDDPLVRGETKAGLLDSAKRYFELAHGYSGGPHRPVLAVLHGLMASGKSALGRWIWGRYGWPVLSSDLIRKKLAGLASTARVAEGYGQGLYSKEMSGRVYEKMFSAARSFLLAGSSVVLDGSFKSRASREAAAGLAKEAGASLVFIKTVCEPGEQRRRLLKRREKKVSSDGRLELAGAQAREFEPPGPVEEGRLLTVRTDGPKERTRALVEERLREHGLAG